MKIKPFFSTLITSTAVGFIVGFILIFNQLRASLFHIWINQYLHYRMIRLIFQSLKGVAYRWLEIILTIAVGLTMIWLIWQLVMLVLSTIHVKYRIKWHAFKMKGQFKSKILRFLAKTSTILVSILILFNLGFFFDNLITPAHKPNVILIVCETLRADHLGYNGYKRNTTPNLDSLAKQAFLFKNAYSQAPSTRPSMWNIVTSKYQSPMPAPDSYLTIAEYFKSNRYKTAAFISQQFLKATKSNLDQGYDLYDADCLKDKHGLSLRRANSITDAAINWIKKDRNWPYFIWLVYFDPHDPYIPPDEFKGIYTKSENFSRDRRGEKIHMKTSPIHPEHRQFLINAYDEEIRYFDYELGRLLRWLKNSGQFDNTIIAFTADHGEELGDNGHRWDHSQLLSQEEIWIPLIIKLPHQQHQTIITEPVQNIDIYPTLVDYFSPHHLPSFSKTLEGKSLLPLMRKEKSLPLQYALSLWQGQRCLIIGNYKYWLQSKEESLINIKTREEINDPARLNKFREELNKILNQYIKKRGYYKKNLEQLKSLGYLK